MDNKLYVISPVKEIFCAGDEPLSRDVEKDMIGEIFLKMYIEAAAVKLSREYSITLPRYV
jgi:hypothetical protein